MSEFVICSFISFLRLACTATRTSFSDESCVLNHKNGILVSLLSRLHDRNEHFTVFDLLCDIGYDTSFSLIANRRFREAGWSRCDLSWNTCNFDKAVETCVEASVEPG